MLKKALIILVVLVASIIGAAIALPIIFKDDLIKIAQQEANKSLNATIDFTDIDVSLFSHFPDFSLTIHDLKVSGKSAFDGIELANIKALEVSIDLMSVIKGEEYRIKTFGLVSPKINIIILEDGSANYDIALTEENATEEEEESEQPASFKATVQEYFIRNAHIIYDDRQGEIFAELLDFTHEGSGDFTEDIFLLKTNTIAQELTLKMEGLSYLTRTQLDMKFDINMDMPNMKFVFDENHVKLNALELNFDGWIAMPDETDEPIDMDLTFGTKQTAFKSILSLIPAVFMSDFDGVETSGSLALSGMAKGRMVGEQYPAFDVALKVADAMFKYPDLPSSAENIQIDLRAKNPGGSDDNTVVDINKFHVEMAKNPIDITLHMRTPISDPYIEATVISDFDLGSIKEVIPLEEGQSLKGQIFSDLKLKGYQSALDQERYQDFEASGNLVLTDFDYADSTMPYATLIKTCSLNFTPQFAELTQLDMMVGKSDIQMQGRVDNVVAWYVADEPLSGRFDLRSNFMDINEFIETDEASEDQTPSDSVAQETTGVAEIPAGLDFILNTDIKKVIYDGIEITNLSGKVVLKDQTIDMENLTMNLMDGSLVLNGMYGTKNPTKPDFNVDMNIDHWDIVTTFKELELIQNMAPVLESATGRFSTGLKMAGQMDQNMDPIYNTLDGRGKLKTHNVKLNSPSTLAKIATLIKYDGTKEITLDNIFVSFKFKDGRIAVDPTSFVIGKEVPSIFKGSHGFDQTLDYVLNLDFPSDVLGGAANQVVSGLFAQANKKLGTNASVPSRIKMDIDITGMLADPKITPRLAGTERSVQDQVKDQLTNELNKQKEELEKKAQAEIDKAKAQAEAEAEKLKQQALEAKAKAEAEAKAKAEAAAKKLEEEAKKKTEEAKKKAQEEAKKALKGLLGK